MSRGKNLGRILFLFAIFALLLVGCEEPSKSALDPNAVEGQEQFAIIKLSIYIMTFVVAVVMIIFFYVLIRYRAKPGDDSIPEQVEGSTKLEILWTVIPIILLVILAIPTLSTTFSLAEEPDKVENPVKVKVVAHQYWWEFEYPELGIKTAQELHLPKGRTVSFDLESRDVIHSFWVPGLAGKQDMIPGRTTFQKLTPTKVGKFDGRCAELCGAGHALMNFEVVVSEEKDFQKWVEARQNPQSQPQNAVEERGKEVFTQNCMSCHAIEGADIARKGTTAPNLTGFGERDTVAGMLENNDENLEKWLKAPDKFKPGTYMPSFDYLNKKDMDSLKEYLKSLK